MRSTRAWGASPKATGSGLDLPRPVLSSAGLGLLVTLDLERPGLGDKGLRPCPTGYEETRTRMYTDDQIRTMLAKAISDGALEALVKTDALEDLDFTLYLRENGALGTQWVEGDELFTSSAHLGLEPLDVAACAESLETCFEVVDSFELVEDYRYDRSTWLGY